MSHDELLNGRPLDADVARTILGFDVRLVTDEERARSTEDGYILQDVEHRDWGNGVFIWSPLRRYSEDMAAAWLVAEKLKEIGLDVIIWTEDGEWEVEIGTTEALYQQGYQGCYRRDPCAAEAICRAALVSFERRP